MTQQPPRVQVQAPPAPIPLQVVARPVDHGGVPRVPAYRPTTTLMEYAGLSKSLAGVLAEHRTEAAEAAVLEGQALGGRKSEVSLVRQGDAWVAAGGDRSLLPFVREGIVRADAKKAAYDRYLAFTNNPKEFGKLTQIEDPTGQGTEPPDIEGTLNLLFDSNVPPSVQNEFGRQTYAADVQRYRDAIVSDVMDQRGKALVAKQERDTRTALQQTLDVAVTTASTEGGPSVAAVLSDYADKNIFGAGIANPTGFFTTSVQQWVDMQAIGGGRRGMSALRVAESLTVNGAELGGDAAFSLWADKRRHEYALQQTTEDENVSKEIAAKAAAVQSTSRIEYARTLDKVKRSGESVVNAATFLREQMGEDDGYNISREAALDDALAYATRPVTDNYDVVAYDVSAALTGGRGPAAARQILDNAALPLDQREKLAGSIANYENRIVGDAAIALSLGRLEHAKTNPELSPANRQHINSTVDGRRTSILQAAIAAVDSGKSVEEVRAYVADAVSDSLDEVAGGIKAFDARRTGFLKALQTHRDHGTDAAAEIDSHWDSLTDVERVTFPAQNADAQSSERWLDGGAEMTAGIATLIGMSGLTPGDPTYAKNRQAITGRFVDAMTEFTTKNRPGMVPAAFRAAYAAETRRVAAEILDAGADPGSAAELVSGPAKLSLPAAEARAAVSLNSRQIVHSPQRMATDGVALYSVTPGYTTPTVTPAVTSAVAQFVAMKYTDRPVYDVRRTAGDVLRRLTTDGTRPSPQDFAVMVQLGAASIHDFDAGEMRYASLGDTSVEVARSLKGVKVDIFAAPLFESEWDLSTTFKHNPRKIDKFLADQGAPSTDREAFRLAQLELLDGH